MSYNPDFFKPESFEHAKSLILTPEGSTTEARWKSETHWTLQMLSTFSQITERSRVLDWGCGVGRLSKAVIQAFGCEVVGVDLQPQMLEYAQRYVADPKFSTVELKSAHTQLNNNSFTHVMAVWVLQHSVDLQTEIPLLYRCLQPGGTIFVVENVTKAIPDTVAFYDDGVATSTVLEETGFETQAQGKIPQHQTTPRVYNNSWWKLLTKPNRRKANEYDFHY